MQIPPGVSRILNALPDVSFPVADARFHRTAEGLTYHPHGPVYFTVTRAGELGLGQDVGIPLTEAIGAYVQLAREQELEDAGPEEVPVEQYIKERARLFVEAFRAAR